ncbi:hypothetical protein PHJA_001208100 [Phtheirospermum japonicum]|uniref:Uncharacterized protein n=1 Tax=Phtheirospermum japonicum TaxID=374723 RepID=A0A830BT74_9LAMI|nr:hypothetical protein PHJA_001208100 [Phtheirospermum japonicum]
MEGEVSDKDSWMPEGWVKKQSHWPSKGKFPGKVDKEPIRMQENNGDGSEEPIRMQENNGDGSEEPSWMQEMTGGNHGNLETSGAVEEKDQKLCVSGKEPIRMQEKNGDGSGGDLRAATYSPGVNHSSEEPSWIQGRVKDGSGVTSEAAEPALEEQITTLRMGDGSGETSEAKQPMEGEDSNNWMPKGWVEKQSQRPLKGKFPGRVDKELGQHSIICIEGFVNEYAKAGLQF